MIKQFTRIRDLGHQGAHECLEQAQSLHKTLTASIANSSTEGKSPMACSKSEIPHVAVEPWRVLSAVLVLGERAHRVPGDLNGIRVALLDVPSALFEAWIEAAMYFPLELFVALPVEYAPQQSTLPLALQAGAHIFLTHEPHMALDGAHAVCFGKDVDTQLIDANGQPISFELALSQYAAPDVLVLNALSDDLPVFKAMHQTLEAWEQRSA